MKKVPKSDKLVQNKQKSLKKVQKVANYGKKMRN